MDVIGELRADVIALQEADRRFGDRLATLPIEALAERTGLRAVELPKRATSSGHHGNCILVRDDVEIARVTPLDLPSLEPRGALVAEVDIRGTGFRIAAVHLGLRAADRVRQAEAVVRALSQFEDDMPTIVLGDINEWAPRGSAVAAFSRSFEPSQPVRSFHTSMPVAPLDRIFIGTGLRFRHVSVHRSTIASRASDHLPLIADLEIVRADHPGSTDTSTEVTPSTA